MVETTPSLPPGRSSLLRQLQGTEPSTLDLVRAARIAPSLRTDVASGAEPARDTDELAELCFREASRAGCVSRAGHLSLAAALLAQLCPDRPAGPDSDERGLTWPASGSQVPAARSHADTPFSTRPAAARTASS